MTQTGQEKRSDEAEWAKLAEIATPGPWVCDGSAMWSSSSDEIVLGSAPRGGTIIGAEDLHFIAASRTAVPALLAALAASRDENERLAKQLDAERGAKVENDRVRTVLYGTDWTNAHALAMRDALRDALHDDEIAVAQYATDQDAAAARVEVSQLRAKIEAVVRAQHWLDLDIALRALAEPLGSPEQPAGS